MREKNPTNGVFVSALKCFFFIGLLWSLSWHVCALDNPADIKHRSGLLWEITAQDYPVSYVFGTVHSDNERIMAIVEEIRPHIQQVSTVCTEIEFDSHALGKANDVMFFDDDHSLRPLLGLNLFEASMRALAGYGISREKAAQLKPWAVILILNQPKDTGYMTLDREIYDEAMRRNKAVCGLESVFEQVRAFSGMSMKNQVRVLQETLLLFPEMPVIHKQLLEIYLNRDLAGLVALTHKYAMHDEALNQAYLKRLIDDRNKRMVHRMLKRMREKSVLFAVGALHLPGHTGVLRLLEDKGFKVKPLL